MKFFRGKKAVIISVAAVLVVVVAVIIAVVCFKKDSKSEKDSENVTIFQSYELRMTQNGDFWTKLGDKSDELSLAGVDYVLLPPAFKAENPAEVGYEVTDLYDLGDTDKEDGIRTKYGTKEQYIKLIKKMHKKDISVIADVPLNEKVGVKEKDKSNSKLNKWGKWFIKTSDIDGFRFNKTQEHKPELYKSFLENVEKENKKNLLSISDYNSSDVKELADYIKKTGESTKVYDNALRNNLFEASKGKYDLSKLFDGTLVSENPDFAVTYVDNHDTQLSPVQPWFKTSAYACILTRQEGTACVFAGDYYGTNDENIGSMKTTLNTLMTVRNLASYGAQNDYIDDEDIIGWTRMGDKKHENSGLAVVISDNEDGNKKMYVGKQHAGESWLDITEKCSDTVTIDKKGYATFHVKGKSCSVWICQNAVNMVSEVTKNEVFTKKFVAPEDNTVTIYYNTEWKNAFIRYRFPADKWGQKEDIQLFDTSKKEYKSITIDLENREYLKCIFSDGQSENDYNNLCNYKFTAGTYTVKNNIVTEGKPEEFTDEDYIIDYRGLLEGDFNSSVTIYYYSPWEETYVHYGINDEWTEAPGVEMKKTDVDKVFMCNIPMNENGAIYMCFNNGLFTWDNNDSKNYMLSSGSYIIYKNQIIEGTYDDIQKVFNGETVTHEKTAETISQDDGEKDSFFTLYFYAGLKKPVLKYKIGKNDWSEEVKFDETDMFGLFRKTVPINKGQYVEVKVGDGNGTWIDNYGANYQLSDGAFLLHKNEILKKVDYEYCKKLYKYDSEEDSKKSKSSSSSTKSNTSNKTASTSKPVTDAKVTVYYYTDWANPHIAFSVGEESYNFRDTGELLDKTGVKGLYTYTISLKSNQKAYVRFNDGAYDWDKEDFSSYALPPGTYIVHNRRAQSATYEDAVKMFTSNEHNYATIYFHAPETWKQCRLQYGTNNSNWKSVFMERIDEENNIFKATFDLIYEDYYEACFDNNEIPTVYDKPSGGGNYKLGKGVSRIKNGTVTRE
ncbi:MAG: DUF1939 domain-containing protein [Lachnospiraceae bacterium]|nr:DUF1939 domain-containing protein [Lachnospiraceae bacterium]